MSELNIPGFIAFLRGEVTIDGHWFGGDGPIRGGIRRNFWWREHLPKLSSHIERQDAEIAQLRADLSESRRLLDEAHTACAILQRTINEARAQKPVGTVCEGYESECGEHYQWVRMLRTVPEGTKLYADTTVPAQPAAIYQCPRCATAMQVDETAKPAAPDIGPMDILRALRDVQPAAVPEAVAKDVSALDDAGQSNRKVAYAWFPLLISRKRQLISDCGITLPQALTESDSQWAMRALLAMLERAECRAAILSAADTEVKNNE